MSSDSIVQFLDELSENLDMIYNKIEQNIHENFPLMVIDNDEYKSQSAAFWQDDRLCL